MTTIRVLESKVCIEPEFLNRSYVKRIHEKLKSKCGKQCDMENGYIISIKKLLRIKDNYISNVSCELIFVVVYEAEILKPEIDKLFSDKVCMIFSGGIFLNICDKFKVLLPHNSLKNYTFDASTKTFVNESSPSDVIKEGSIISVKITGLKYQKNNFSCFGELAESC
jgi:DNA-directed RNA polymerase subunit E'/Rpb7